MTLQEAYEYAQKVARATITYVTVYENAYVFTNDTTDEEANNMPPVVVMKGSGEQVPFVKACASRALGKVVRGVHLEGPLAQDIAVLDL
jgi:hypothetical protein